MNKEINELLIELKKELSPLRKNIFSFIVHGSSVYSNKLKPHQDIDLFIIFKKMDFNVLNNFKKILNNFLKKSSLVDKKVYYSIAGAGRGSVEKTFTDKNQIFRLEFYVNYESDFKYTWKRNFSFPFSLCKNYKILIGEDIGKYLQYVGDSENKISLLDGWDKFQWSCCSILESDLDESVVFSSIQESVFYDLTLLFLAYKINENRKDFMIEKFKKEFYPYFKKYRFVLNETNSLRKGNLPTKKKGFYFNSYHRFNKFVRRKIYEKIGKI